MNEIEEVRRIQEDCIRLHLIPPALGILKVEKINKDNVVIDGFEQKSNSYVRNAYNYIIGPLCSAWATPTSQLPTTYDAGGVALKTNTGTLVRGANLETNFMTLSEIRVGSGSTVDTLNDFNLQTIINNLTPSTTTANGSYDSGSKKLTTTVSRTFVNTTSSSITVRETGAFMAGIYLAIRDVFTAVTLDQFEGIIITYTLEFTFP